MLKEGALAICVCAALCGCETKSQKAETELLREQLILEGKDTTPADELREEHIGKNIALTSAAVITAPIWVPLGVILMP